MHEFGHFLAAKACGIQVNEYAIGMGPKLISFQRGEYFQLLFKKFPLKPGKKGIGLTAYSLRLLPIGGFCAMEGEDEESEEANAFGNQPVWKRLIVCVAGAFTNFVAGMIVIAVIFGSYEAFPKVTLTEFADGFEYEGEAMLMEGDEVVKVNGYNILSSSDFSMMLGFGEGKPFNITVIRDGQKVHIKNLLMEKKEFSNEDGTTSIRYGISSSAEWVEADFGDRVGYILKTGDNFVKLIWISLGQLFTRQASVSDMTGVVGITKTIGDTAKESMPQMWYLVAFIAINLAVMNLLPLPALDGGRIMFLLVELIRGKPIKQKYEAIVHLVGIVLLMGLMLFVTYNDIVKLIRG